MRRMASRLAFGFLALGSALIFSVKQCPAQVFHDDFDGDALNPAVWTIDATDGQVTVSDGYLYLSSASPVFPVVTSTNDLFPAGDFRVIVGLQYLAVDRCGDGFGSMDNFWEDYYSGTACRPFLLWQDSGGLYVYAGSSGLTGLAPPSDLGYHVYEWTYVGGQYDFWMDGVHRASGGCGPRPTKVFFGHPHPITCAPWTEFAVDFIDISPIGATRDVPLSWGKLKLTYR